MSRLVAGLTLIGWVALADEALAFRMVPMNVAEMSAEAERIVVGVCTAREDGDRPVSPGGPLVRFTQYTFQVTDSLKGNVGQTLTIRQVRLGQRPAPSDTGQTLLREVLPLPDYQPGQEVLLFLGPDSSLGLTSPVAMDQAVFDVETLDGQRMLRNRSGNRPLFRDMSATQLTATRGLSAAETALFPIKEGESIPYAPFLSLIRKLANSN